MSTAALGSPVERKFLIGNVLIFQACWFACVLGAAKGLPWAGVVVTAAALAWHLRHAGGRSTELRLLVVAALAGLAFETLLMQAGWVSFAEGVVVEGVAPVWMVALWLAFATTLNVSLRWLQDHLALAALLGAVGGPLSYWAGARLGALVLLDPSAALIAIGAGWALLTPALLVVARALNERARALA